MSRCAQGASPTYSCRNRPAPSTPPFRSPMLARSATADFSLDRRSAGSGIGQNCSPAAVADLANIGDRNGGMLVAGLFLQEFVGDTPWAHLDIAGPAFNEDRG